MTEDNTLPTPAAELNLPHGAVRGRGADLSSKWGGEGDHAASHLIDRNWNTVTIATTLSRKTWFSVRLKKEYTIEGVTVYQARYDRNLEEGFCDDLVTHESRVCICEPDAEECRGLEVKLDSYDTGLSCGSPTPNIKSEFIVYEWKCSSETGKTQEVYIISAKEKPIPVNEIIVTTSDTLGKLHDH